ncbi:uncharacterized protein EI97DRAFT_438929 [Westerdykella ornata]|uniref:Uncharacterized protein n=1 Tax=Westerdykella ornata TaxID=318751 RepID=A0A6A6K0G0_WESOR|nr:uncharacterized protein EI97DRAFT_438929 [Westerdykella ornata]KAF2281608.1 hypothetical protein EI97DRAFT_438929 [Westerdykella ornata]
MSFGHPGISALEFAGGATGTGLEERESSTPSALKSKGKAKERTGSIASTTTTTATVSTPYKQGTDYPSIDAHLSPFLPEVQQQRRRKGASFVNHTPRRFELRKKAKATTMGLGIDTSGDATGAGTRKTASWTQYWHQSPPRDWSLSEALRKEGLEMGVESETGTAAGSEGKERETERDRGSEISKNSQFLRMGEMPGPLSSNPVLVTFPEQSTRAVEEGEASESERSERVSSGSATTPARYQQKDAHSNRKLKRRRRQTPFKISVPAIESLKAMGSGRHSPLEPWVAMHRREADRETDAYTQHMVAQEEPAVGEERGGTVDVEDDAEPGAEGQDPDSPPLLALQSYFDSQASASTASPQSSDHPTCSGTSAPTTQHIPLPRRPTPEDKTQKSKTEHQPPIFLIDDIAVSHTPDLPSRNPNRLTGENPHSPSQTHASPTSGIRDSDFTSAAKGQYSPYSPSQRTPAVFSPPTSPTNRIASNSGNETPYGPQPVNMPKLRTVDGRIPSNLVVGRVGSSRLGRMAPPILGHEALTATAVLNDLSYYLKNTGPPSENASAGRSRAAEKRRGGAGGFRIFKVRGVGSGGGSGTAKKGKKSNESSLAKRVGSVEGSPHRDREKERKEAVVRKTPACAREMITSGGAKHLRIVIPYSPEEQDAVGVKGRVELEGCAVVGEAKKGDGMWTDEMLNPLGSEAVERAIEGKSSWQRVEEQGNESQRTATRSPKRSPIEAKPIPVHEHPLLTREEQTRARKLRDLERVKKQLLLAHAGMNGNAKLKGVGLERQAKPPSVARPPSGEDNVIKSCNEAPAPEGLDAASAKIRTLQQKVNVLQRQNKQLAEALAWIVGFEVEDEEVDVEGLLKVYRQMRKGSGGDAFGYGGAGGMEQRRGRVFTR